jgi:hypothetical protein
MAEIEDQPAPTKGGNGASVQELVRADLVKREEIGIERYGTALFPFNGRNSLVDAYQEALDLVVYIRQTIAEGGLVGRHGADDTPYEPHTEGMTPGILLARILDGDTDRRLEICRNLITANKGNWECLQNDHVGMIGHLRKQILDLSRALIRSMNGIPVAPDSDAAGLAEWEVNRADSESR